MARRRRRRRGGGGGGGNGGGGRIRQAAANVVYRYIPGSRRVAQSDTFKTFADMFMENAAEGAGGVVSSAVDAYVSFTDTKTDDEYARPVKALAGNGLKLIAKKTGGRLMRIMGHAFNGHNYGEWASEKVLKKLTGK